MGAGTNFELRLVGHGWEERVIKDTAEKEVDDTVEKEGDGMFKHKLSPNKEVTVSVKGANIGYGSTSECLVQAALVILQEREDAFNRRGLSSRLCLCLH